MYQACFYECDPAAGLWRKHPKHVFQVFDTETGADGEKVMTIGNKTLHNAWQIANMPIHLMIISAFTRPSSPGGLLLHMSRLGYSALSASSFAKTTPDSLRGRALRPPH